MIIIASLLSALKRVSIDGIQSFIGIEEAVRFLKEEKIIIQKLIEDAYEKHVVDERQMQLLIGFLDLVKQIEISIDKWQETCPQSQEHPLGIRNHITGFYKYIRKTPGGSQFREDMTNIQERISKMQDMRKECGIIAVGEEDDIGVHKNKRRKLNQAHKLHLMGDPDIEGFGTDHIINIRKLLLDGENTSLAVVSIVSIGGSGKSTITLKLCNSSEVKDSFPTIIWIDISQYCVMTGILREIARKLNIRSITRSLNGNELGKQILERLRQTRYLIVLDDVSSEELWPEISKILPDENNGSRVIITTRSENVAKRAATTYPPYKLPPLDSKESIDLFLKNAVNKNNGCPHPYFNLDNLAKEFATKCQGLPLALVVLGRRVSTEPYNFHAWNELLKTMTWVDDGKYCIRVLSTSYDQLHFAKKLCFLYFAAFPKDTLIEAKLLYRIWIVENLIPKKERKTLEETARCFLEDLVQRNLVHVSETFPDGSIRYVQIIHNVLKEFVVQEAQKCDFLIVCSKPDDWERCCNSRRVAIHYLLDLNESIGNYLSPNIYSLIIFGGSEVLRLDCSKFKMLRVLGCMKMGMVKLESFEGAPHLRYLQLAGTCIRGVENKFESWVRDMKWLEVLDLRTSDHGDLSYWIWKSKALRHVLLNDSIHVATKGPSPMADLKHVQTITGVRWDRSWELVKCPNISEVRELGIVIDGQIPKREIEKFLGPLNHLVDLWIKGDVTVLQNICWDMFPFYPNLKSLSLTENNNDGGRYDMPLRLVQLPGSIFPSHLTMLCLIVDKFGSDPMEMMEKLESLRSLTLGGTLATAVKRIKCSSGGFKQLEVLKLKHLPLVEWKIESGAMPILKVLSVNCDPLNVPEEMINLDSVQEVRWYTNIQTNKDAISNIVEQRPQRLLHWLYMSFADERRLTLTFGPQALQ